MLGKCVCALILSATLVAEQQSPVFKSGVSLVTVDVIVLDKNGHPVPGLTADEFQIKLNGKLQPVRAMSYVQVAQKQAAQSVTGWVKGLLGMSGRSAPA